MAVKTVKYTFNGTTYDLTYNSSTGKYEATVTAPSKSSYSQTDHKYGGTLVATDQAGNSTSVTETHSTLGTSLKVRVLEKVAPVLTFNYPTSGAFIANSTPTIKFTITDADSGVDSSKITLKVDGTAVTSITKTATTNGYTCTYTPTTALADGQHTLEIGGADNDDNSATAKSITFKVDTIPPVLTVTSPTNGLITNKTSLTVSGTTDDATSKPVTVKVNGTAVTVNSDGTFSTTITLSNGSNTITVVATDKAGKASTITRTVTLDTSAPVFKSVTVTPNPVDCGKTFVISVEVTD